MNLNISTNIMDYFQGNTNTVDGNCNKNEFSGLFEMMEESLVDIDGELEINIEDSEGNIDDELLQSILSSLNISNLNSELDNINSMSNKSEQDINSLIDDLNNLDSDKLIGNLLSNNIQDEAQLSKDIFNNLMQDIVVDDELLNLRQQPKAKNINSEENILSSSIEEATNIQSDEVDKSIENQRNNIIDVVNIEESYNQLEISSLSNKSSLFNNTKSELENDDLDTLEGILEEDSNNFISFNNIVTEAENNSSVVDIESAPIREVRQEVIGDDIVQTVRYLNENGLEEIKVKINPRELGEMTIKIMKSLEETKLSITITNEDIYDLVNKNVSEITKHLKSLDINVKEVFVDVKSNNEHFFSDNLNQEFDRNNKNNGNQKKNKPQNFETENVDSIDEIEIKNDNLNILI